MTLTTPVRTYRNTAVLIETKYRYIKMTVLQGIVTKAGVMGKTVTVTVSLASRSASRLVIDEGLESQVSRKVIHPILLKELKRHKKFLVHDEHEREWCGKTDLGSAVPELSPPLLVITTEARLDDRVSIQLGKPQSKRKSFYLTQIHSRGSALATPATSAPGAAVPEDESEILKQVQLAEKSMGSEGREKQEKRRLEEEREHKVLEKMGIETEA